MSQKDEETSGRGDLQRTLRAVDALNEGTALINWMLAKRNVRSEITPEQVVELVQQTNAAVVNLNNIQNTLDTLMPRKARSISIAVGEGEMRAAPDQG